jgi:hypothetical protein
MSHAWTIFLIACAEFSNSRNMLLNIISLGWHSLRQGKCSNVFANDSVVNDKSLTKHQICSKISLIISTPLLRKIAIGFYKEAKVLFISADFNIVKKENLFSSKFG